MNIHVTTHGCSANLADTQLMLGLLDEAGYSLVENVNEAELCIVNMCSVKGEQTVLRSIRGMQQEKIIVTGCIPRTFATECQGLYPHLSLVSTQNIHAIVGIVEKVMQGKHVLALSNGTEPQKVGVKRIRTNPTVGIVPILTGCDLQCTYCSVKLIKPTLQSYDSTGILQEVSDAVKDGCKEIWLTSMDNAVYGVEYGKFGLPLLLKKICSVQGNFKVRVGMMNPHHTLKQLPGLVQAMRNDKIYQFLHLPIQSGSNRILKLMGRRNTKEEFLHIVNTFRNQMPNVTLTTDIIVGFPTETDRDFQETVQLLHDVKADNVNISRYAPRPGTASIKLPQQLHGREKKQRSRIVTSVYHSVAEQINRRWIGWHGEVVILEKHANSVQGRNFAYKPVVLQGNYDMGSTVTVEIYNATAFDLRAHVVESTKLLKVV